MLVTSTPAARAIHIAGVRKGAADAAAGLPAPTWADLESAGQQMGGRGDAGYSAGIIYASAYATGRRTPRIDPAEWVERWMPAPDARTLDEPIEIVRDLFATAIAYRSISRLRRAGASAYGRPHRRSRRHQFWAALAELEASVMAHGW